MNAGLRVLIIGNFLSSLGKSRGVCEELSDKLRQITKLEVKSASSKPSRLGRLIDMVSTAYTARAEYDVAQVDVFSGSAFLWAELVCATLRRIKKPYVLTLHGGELPEFAERYPRRVKTLLARASAVTTPSGFLRKRLGYLRSDLLLIPNGISVDLYPFRERSRLAPKLVWLRSFHSIYNPMLAVEVGARVKLKFPSTSLVMYGGDKGDGALQATWQRANSLQFGTLQTPGPIPKNSVGQALSEADIFLNTTNVDNAPVSVIEAMACGLCVVSTDVGGIPHLVSDRLDALLTPRGDCLAMAGGVCELLSDTRLARSISRKARQNAEGMSWDNVLPKWLGLLNEVYLASNSKAQASASAALARGPASSV